MSRAQLTSTVEQNTGGAVAPFVAGKNKIINGDFGIWQRGTSFAAATTVYTADRWFNDVFSSGATTVTRQTFTPGAAPVTGYEGQYFLRVNSTSTYSVLRQRIENVQTFAGQTTTISFWAKSATPLTLTIGGYQNFGTGGSTLLGLNETPVNLTSNWTRYTYTIAVPSISGKTIGTNSLLELYFYTATLNTNIDFWGIQWEAGSVATPFTTATGTLSGELQACQRYYWRTSYDSTYGAFGSGIAYSTTAVRALITPPVQMRVAPTAIDYGGTNPFWFTDGVANQFSNTAPTLQTGYFGTRNTIGVDFTGTSSLTQYRPYIVGLGGSGNSSQYIGFTAEL